MESVINSPLQICFSSAELLAQYDYELSRSIVDIALEKSRSGLEEMTASIAIILALELVTAVKIKFPTSNIPGIIAQAAFELSNSIEPLLIAL